MPGEHLVRLEGVTAAYGRTTVLESVDCTFRPGELVGIVGPSGSGKSTLLNILAGRLRPRAGAVIWDPAATRRIGVVPQLSGIPSDAPLTVRHATLLGITASSSKMPWFSSAEKRRTDEVLDRLGLSSHRHKLLGELSGGQYQRFLLARALARGGEMVILDEPTSGVDLAVRREILNLLAEVAASGVTTVLTTHDLNWVAAQLPRVVCLNGRVVADGAPLEALTESTLERTFGAPVQVTVRNGMVMVGDVAPSPGGAR